jgi:hypothetical protein
MDIPALSNDSLIDLHAAIRAALAKDDATTDGPKPFGVREHSDWRIWANELETELDKRRIAYAAIPW